jgi:hypothetical protein
MSTPYEPARPAGQQPPTASTTAHSGAYGTSGPSSDASVGEMFAEVSKDLSTLIRQEVELAKAETTVMAKEAGKTAGFFGGAAWAANMMMLFLSLALWWAIGAMLGQGDEEPSLGWAAVIVAVIWAIVAAILAQKGKKAVPKEKGLPQTADTLKKIPTALKGQEPS